MKKISLIIYEYLENLRAYLICMWRLREFSSHPDNFMTLEEIKAEFIEKYGDDFLKEDETE